MSAAAVVSPDVALQPGSAAGLLICVPTGGDARERLAPVLRAAGLEEAAIASPDAVAGERNFALALPRDEGLLPWFTSAESVRAIVAAAGDSGAERCLLLGNDAAETDAGDLATMAQALAEPGCAAVSPLYSAQANEGLLNSAVVYPLVRALYGRRVRYPLAAMAGASTALLQRMAASARGGLPLFPIIDASAAGQPLCQACVSATPPRTTAGRSAEETLAGILGPLFTDVEAKAALWQRTRPAEEPRTFGTAHASAGPEQDLSAEAPRLVEQFQLAARNLADVWTLVMPPATQFALKRVVNPADGKLTMPEPLWARVVYDFTLAHRTRVISRAHLFGAFTPLYLAWVASFLGAPSQTAEARIEQQARAFEQERSYLLQRWRWPDRFNP